MSRKTFRPDVDAPEYKGSYSPYDIVKEGTIALVVVAILTILLSAIFGSPDVKAVSLKSWSRAAPVDFATTALDELNGSTITASYGPPYNHNGPSQSIGFLQLAKWVGVRIPIDAAQDFVVDPLQSLPASATLTPSLHEWLTASPTTQATWVANYTKGSAAMAYTNGQIVEKANGAGPVPVMINSLTQMARSGALDTDLISGNGFYSTDYTKPLLFLADGGYIGNIAVQQHLDGPQWGMMNETGSYPGQAWLWLYTFWYQVPPFNSSSNGDALVWGVMMVLSLGLLLVPFVPGLRSIPRKTRVYRIIWREHYRSLEKGASP